MLFTDGRQWWRYIGTGILGTSLLYRRSFWEKHNFQPRRIGEDWRFSQIAAGKNELLTLEALELMVATVHSENTSARALDAAYVPVENFAGVPGFTYAT
jgi:hypothetical protein